MGRRMRVPLYPPTGAVCGVTLFVPSQLVDRSVRIEPIKEIRSSAWNHLLFCKLLLMPV